MAHIDIAYPGASVAFDGIADHTARLAGALADRGHDVRVLGRGPGTAHIGGYEYVDAWGTRRIERLDGLVAAVKAGTPDLLVVQFEQFAYGVNGFSPELTGLMARLRLAARSTTTMLFAHETYVTPTTTRRSVAWAYQSTQLRALARGADHVVTNCAVGMRRIGKFTEPVGFVPVPSNIPRLAIDREHARRELGLEQDALYAVVFGHLDQTRITLTTAALTRIQEAVPVELIYVGKDGDAALAMAGNAGVPAHTFIGASERVASLVLSSADLAVTPFADGASGKRGSLAACLEHRLPSVTNRGDNTDQFLVRASDAGALALAESEPRTFASAAAALATDAPRRAAMTRALESGDVRIASWDDTADAVEARLPAAVRA